jgi:formimidoylglutamate deiminase
MTRNSLFAEHARLQDGWRRNVLLEWDDHGTLLAVTPDSTQPAGVNKAKGPVLAGMPNLHSHAFQRAMAGLTEYRANPTDSFWSWRDLMYRFAARISPNSIGDIAR